MDEATTLLKSLAVITPFAVTDAVAALPANLAIMVALLATRRPILAASAYALGVFLGGVLSGIVVAFGLHGIADWIVDSFDGINQQGSVYMTVQGIIGLALIVTGAWWFRTHPRTRTVNADARANSGVVFLLAGTFGMALVSMFTRLPVALPYLATVDRLLRMPTSAPTKLVGLMYHNLVLILPIVLLLVLALVSPTRTATVLAAIQRWINTWGRKGIAILLIALGVLLAADTVGSRLGRPILPVIDMRGAQATASGSVGPQMLYTGTTSTETAS